MGVELLTERHKDQIAGVLSCYDRIIIQGTVPGWCYASGMTDYFYKHQLRIFDYPKWAEPLRESLRANMERIAAESRIGIEFVRSRKSFRKEHRVKEILEKRGEQPGVVCILSAMEPCGSYKPWHDKKTHTTYLKPDDGKCLHYYVYFIDDDLGLCSVRVPTWCPFRLQFYCNGHSVLARQMTKRNIEYRVLDNAFGWIADFEQAQKLARAYRSVRVRVLNEAQIRRLKMGCFLAVTRGSEQPPRFLIIEHRGGRRSSAPVVLVGKGVTFDTGGISLKDPAAMDEMKFDMCGAATVIAALDLAARSKLPLNVVGLVPCCENMPDGRAIKPGDVAVSASGQTVEILNTDAEGRLILCDALHYARRYKPAALIDFATLTGACVIALGNHHSGLLGNDEPLINELLAAGRRSDDRAWQLPLTEEYGEQLRTNFADMANIAGREGGTITAAAFLSKFTQGMKWAHMDIAGTAWLSGASKGATGRPLSLVADFLVHRARS